MPNNGGCVTIAELALGCAINFFAVERFLDEQECQRLRGVMRESPLAAATVARGTAPTDYAADEERRRTRRSAVSADEQASFVAKLEAVRENAAAHFGEALAKTEEPQFLIYRTGDFFVRHTDRDRAGLKARTISIIVFLSEPGPATYLGGDLKFTGYFNDRETHLTLRPSEGLLIAFPSHIPHEVTPVESGERFTIVSWFA